jgi:hypothetical protein
MAAGTVTYYTGKDGAIYVKSGRDTDPSAADLITAADFKVGLSRNVVNVGKIGAANDMSYPGKLAITGSLTQVLVTPEYLAWALGDTDDLDGTTHSYSPGNPQYFSIWGKLLKDSEWLDVSANNCFITGGELPIGDADTVVQCDLPFQIEDPSTDFKIRWDSGA